jgi:hypothetical protein
LFKVKKQKLRLSQILKLNKVMIKPKHDSFENAFKEAFDKASLAPPDIIWENIEKSLPQETTFGTKSDGNNSAIQTKLIVGTGIILVSAITFLYFNDSSTKNSKSDLNSTKNETIFTKPIKPAIANTKAEIENVVVSPTFVAKKQYKPQVKSNFYEDQITPETLEIEDYSFQKIDVNVSEMKPKGLHLPTITLETPDLVPNTDSQYVAPYFIDQNTIGNPEKSKSNFWRNFRITGGIRVSNY